MPLSDGGWMEREWMKSLIYKKKSGHLDFQEGGWKSPWFEREWTKSLIYKTKGGHLDFQEGG